MLDHFAKYGKVKRPYLGVELEESWEAVVGLPSENGLRVAYVDPESPAAKAGIAEGDQLLAIGETRVNTLAAYHEALKKYLPDDTVTLTIRSGSNESGKQVKLGEDTTVHSEWMRDAGSANIDADHGKTLIGDSHFGWSMKYPAGLIKDMQSSDGAEVTFEDSKGEYSLDIHVKDISGSELSTAGLFDKLEGAAADTVLEKQYVRHRGASYAKVTAKSQSGSFYESRAYQQAGYVYVLTLTVHDEAAYSNKFKLNSLIDLLNSFRLSFDKNDSSLKDISVVKSGGSRVLTEYGLSFELPADWNTGDREQGSYFTSEDYKRYVAVTVTSASPGDTLDAWLDRSVKAFEGDYAADYRKTGEAHDITVAGIPAKTIETSWTMGGAWSSATSVLFMKDKYKYEIEIGYPQDGDGNEAFVKSVVDSIELDPSAIDPALGFIQDVRELIDPAKTVMYKSDKYKYTLTVPESWHAVNTKYSKEKDSPILIYSFHGGTFSVRADTSGKLSDTVKDREAYYKKNAADDSEYKYTESDETVFGAAGKKIELQYTANKVPFRSTEYVFEKNKIVYTVVMRLNDAMRTEQNVDRLNAAFQSMQFKP
ncbi:PDZ domain-containing protein [Gordoniibacillus kamchatkensis]|uniref:PDZ domain-containing protein n=1 Tax=Gordoniibacillus kamchatkensis TaxID=1590651 RepID=UPI000695B6DD|nr:PDZ domain-containing protein [Paenibacillus sp. VKM B-2647]